MKRKLKFGIMCHGPELAAWEKKCIDYLIEQDLAEPTLIILDVVENYPNKSLLQKIKSVKFSNLFFHIYLRKVCRPRSLKRESFSEIFDSLPQIKCIIKKKGKFSQYFSAENVEEIKSYELDFIFRFGFNIIRGEILGSANYGVWSFHHDDELRYRGAPPCFWEIYNNDPQTGSILQRLTHKLDAGIILKKGIFRTKSFSYAKNIDQAYFETAKWPAWVCKEIINGADYQNLSPATTTAPIYTLPTNKQLIKFIYLLFKNFIRHIGFRFFIMQKWNVALVEADIEAFINHPSSCKYTFIKQKSRHSFNADCFGIKQASKTYIFFEQLDYSGTKAGEIKINVIDDVLNETKQFQLQLKNIDCHLSYPFLFKEEDCFYLIPETGEKESISLYEPEFFPDKWTLKQHLLTGQKFYDATLLKHNDKYWLFYTVHGKGFDADLHLHIAYSDKLCGTYNIHPANPVKISARSARPAGNFFKNSSGELIRPAQNFTKSYGGSIVLNKVIELTETSYKEEEIKEILPFDSFYKDGLHTINELDKERVLVDVKRHVFRFYSKVLFRY